MATCYNQRYFVAAVVGTFSVKYAGTVGYPFGTTRILDIDHDYRIDYRVDHFGIRRINRRRSTYVGRNGVIVVCGTGATAVGGLVGGDISLFGIYFVQALVFDTAKHNDA